MKTIETIFTAKTQRAQRNAHGFRLRALRVFPVKNSSSHRRGFTLIELLVVMGIILILIGLVIGGMKIWGTQSATSVTKARFEALNGMLANLEASAPNTFSSNNPAISATYYPWVSTESVLALPTPGSASPGSLSYSASTLPASAFAYFTSVVLGSAGNPTTGDDGRNEAMLYTDIAILDQLITIPANATILGQMPTNAKAVPTTEANVPSGTSLTSDLLDGWNNPIIFVPAGGLSEVYSSQAGPSSGSFSPGALVALSSSSPTKINGQDYYEIYTCISSTTSGPPNPSTAWAPGVRSPDGKPFWASAGPDGNFQLGDDNIYSFQP
ncbi:MAG TPA: prepilin-type N-terminal cleavage/methylation domain-containing protein [Tepidisphaeraceae bacterium]|nr:prepilin-type N-terminal cleavage/methylation domain-containing protein [Tepidisphaeraceae bacterium]